MAGAGKGVFFFLLLPFLLQQLAPHETVVSAAFDLISDGLSTVKDVDRLKLGFLKCCDRCYVIGAGWYICNDEYASFEDCKAMGCNSFFCYQYAGGTYGCGQEALTARAADQLEK